MLNNIFVVVIRCVNVNGSYFALLDMTCHISRPIPNPKIQIPNKFIPMSSLIHYKYFTNLHNGSAPDLDNKSYRSNDMPCMDLVSRNLDDLDQWYLPSDSVFVLHPVV